MIVARSDEGGQAAELQEVIELLRADVDELDRAVAEEERASPAGGSVPASEQLRSDLKDLGRRLTELDTRIDAGDAESRRSLTAALRDFGGLAAVIDPQLIVPAHDDERAAKET